MNKRIMIAVLAATLCGLASQAQPARSGYFLPGVFNRTKINPSVINKTGYFGMPFLSDISISASTNTGIANYIFPYAPGGLTTFMNRSVSASDFLSQLPSASAMNIDLSMDYFSGGYYFGESYQTIALTFRSMSSSRIPYALFDFMKSGMTSPSTHYSIEDLRFETENFLEFSWSYARPINDQWKVGGRAKFLLGLAYADARISKMDISMSADEWLVSSKGQMTASSIVALSYATNDDGNISGLKMNNGVSGSTSFGFSFDFGATFKPADRWTVSLAGTDVGMIFWQHTADAYTNGTPFSFKGFKDIPVGLSSGSSLDDQIKELKNQAADLFGFYPTATPGSRTQMLKATINLSGEYEIFEDLFSVGVLSSTRIDPIFTVSELIVSANYRPSNSWFNAAVTFDVSNVAYSMGTVINFCPKGFNFFLGVDYMLWHMSPMAIPLYGAAPRVNFGINIPLGSREKYYLP